MGNILVAHMSSKGRWYGPVVQANCVLARRAVQEIPGVSYESLKAMLKRDLPPDHFPAINPASINPTRMYPTSRQVRQWEIDQPDLPESMVRLGVINRRDIHPNLQPYLKTNDAEAPMSSGLNPQIQRTTMGHSASSQVDSSGQGWGLFLLIITGLCLLSDSNSAVEEPVRPVERSRSRGLSLTGRKDKYRSN